MDVFTLIFVLFILAAGLVLALAVNRDSARRTEPRGDEPDSARYQHLKEWRQMERRRLRVWWKMDELHAEFTKRTGAGPETGAAPGEAPRQPNGRAAPPGGGVTLGEVRDAFEEFLGKR